MEVLAEITAAAFAALFGDGPEARGDAELGYLCSIFFWYRKLQVFVQPRLYMEKKTGSVETFF